MVKAKSQILSKVATLLEKFSGRLTRVAAQTRQNTDNIAALQDLVLSKVNKLEGILVDVNDKAERAYAVLIHQGGLFDKLEAKVDDQSNVQSLASLRDSTSAALNQVKAYVEALLRTTQSLNERIGQVESQNSILVSRLNTPDPAPQISSGPDWLNQRLMAWRLALRNWKI